MVECLLCSSSRLSNGETESVKTMIVHDEGESDAGSTPCKDSTLIVRQVEPEKKNKKKSPNHSIQLVLPLLLCSSIPPYFFHIFFIVLILFCSCLFGCRAEKASVGLSLTNTILFEAGMNLFLKQSYVDH